MSRATRLPGRYFFAYRSPPYCERWLFAPSGELDVEWRRDGSYWLATADYLDANVDALDAALR